MVEFTGCTRSHPHENMSDECKFKTETARTINKLANEVAQAKQRELELLAVVEFMRDGLDDYWVTNNPIPEPSQALREHEAKVLEEAAAECADTPKGREVAEWLRRMAEERRKK